MAVPAAVVAQEDVPRPVEPRVVLRMVADSSVIGHYRFSIQERQQLLFDIAPDDPRAALLESATVPKQTNTDIAATIVSTQKKADEERRYFVYWLGYRVSGDDLQTLTPIQWDSIFQAAGRRAVLRVSPQGRPTGVEVTSDAVRPVARALAGVLSALALTLPADTVSVGSRWDDNVALKLKAPDGSERTLAVHVNFRLRAFQSETGEAVARIEFDGEPVHGSLPDAKVAGRYYGETFFAVERGRYKQGLALANFEIEWENSGGLPPSRSIIEWQAQFVSR
jgi:hypothetical protein